ncbi:DUF2631 domain-containing protein [Nocardia donostiensis]|uniref:DUF2631 domain-containing protein n=1 Tax=Nocardia donostiensis TaxID=1538463 RepID=A0A1V2TIN8_9NOCA|nr:DUF2631 domain-containing protein [Nocardia donostiensis]ONM49364.1 hypothetical protein B0T46_08385 [Nocardia donostiensis]OQS14884.1 hypothetical protein B0T36_12645 [Nocardia donostiensis]OQS16069.1 hypothetical protein B0T44_25640 [Nocardia donostiensis]
MAAKELEPTSDRAVTTVDPAEVPSAAWGWSGESRRTFQVAGWFVVFALLAMIIGNHQGQVENIFLVGFAALMAFILVRDVVLRRKPR